MDNSRNQQSAITVPESHLRVILPPENGNPATPELPPYIDLGNEEHYTPPEHDYSAPPPYDLATQSKLPTYEEVQREKELEANPTLVLPPGQSRSPFSAYVSVDQGENSLGNLEHEESNELGTDLMFFTAFFVAFLFNWIGFLLLMCFCRTIASRYGALAGFGLSLAKWTLIVKHSTELASHENSWLWWLIMAFGIIICLRAIIQYLNIKRNWELLSMTAQERLLLF